MKKITGILLLAVFAFNALVFLPMFRYVIKQNRREIKTRILNSTDYSQYDVIYFTDAELMDLYWHDQYEFSYKENKYDLVSMSKTNQGTTKIICFNDIKEKEIFAGLDSYFKEEFNTGTNKGKSLQVILNYFAVNYIMPNPFLLNSALVNTIANTYSLNNEDFFFRSRSMEVASPPPELV